MEFEIARATFEKALALTQGVVEKRNTLPILSNALIETGEASISVLATDLDVGIRRTCEGRVKKAGVVTVNARKLYEIVRQAPGDDVKLKSTGPESVEISSGRSRFRLVGIDPKEFPKLPGLQSKPGKGATKLTASAEVLRSMIERTAFAVSTDETRFNLSGVYAENREGQLRMVATDGHRLSMVDRDVEGVVTETGVILPRKGLAEVRKLLDDLEDTDPVSLVVEGSMARMGCGASELFMTLVEGEFPDYHQVIPKKGKVSIGLSRDELLAALRRVAILSTERSKGVRLTFRSGTLEVQAHNPDLGEASEEMEIGYSGDEISVGFNARYLIESLLVLPEGDRIEMTITDNVSPGVLRAESDESYLYVVMPMRL